MVVAPEELAHRPEALAAAVAPVVAAHLPVASVVVAVVAVPAATAAAVAVAVLVQHSPSYSLDLVVLVGYHAAVLDPPQVGPDDG